MIELYRGDCLDVLPTLEADSVDTCITDPPYGLEFMGKGWDYGVPGVPFWREVLRVLKPGAMLLAFGGTRTHHRLMVAIEDAGFEIRDAMMWLYGSGFPKSHDISKAIDKAKGANGEYGDPKTAAHAGRKQLNVPDGWDRPWMKDPEAMNRANNKYLPTTDAAHRWNGYGTALKPAWEIVIVAMKPRTGTFADNALEHGVAGLWIDGCRIATDEDTGRPHGAVESEGWRLHKRELPSLGHAQGRWPANVILQHHESCERMGVKRVKGDDRKVFSPERKQSKDGVSFGVGASTPSNRHGTETVAAWNCHPDCAVRMLGEQSGAAGQQVTPGYGRNAPKFSGTAYNNGKRGGWEYERVEYADTGTAARFFYQAKASKSERNQGLPDGMVNNHPTVKPVDLLRYLARLTKTPTGGVVLDPFMGSGSTGVAAILEGRGFIGIELDADPNVKALEIARHRCEWAEAEAKRARQLTLPLPPPPVDTPGQAR